MTTSITCKLPNDYEVQGKAMTHICIYLISVHNILSELDVNTKQTGIYIVSTSRSRTWKMKGAKHIKIHGQDYKQQIIMAVSSTTNGIYFFSNNSWRDN